MLSDGEEIMTLAFFVLIQYQSMTDGQTDGQTDIPPLAIPAVCIARYANALVKKNHKTLSGSSDLDCIKGFQVQYASHSDTHSRYRIHRAQFWIR